MSTSERNKKGEQAGFIGIAVNLILVVLKLIAGFYFNSIAVIADGVNNLSDTASSAITIFGFRISQKPADKKHPYGHARMEYISALMVSFIIIFLALQLLWSSLWKIINPDPMNFSFLTVGILSFSIAIKSILWIYYSRTGKKINSITLVAAAHDSRNDIISTSAILVSVITFYFTGLDLDGYMGLLVAGFILYFGIKLISDTINPLLGTAPSKKFTDKISKKIMEYEDVIGFHDLTIHNYGYKKSFASVHCEVAADKDIIKSHEIIDRIERDFLRDMNLQMVIHVDPVLTRDDITIKAEKMVADLVGNISKKIKIHDFRVVRRNNRVKYIFDIAVPYDFIDDDSTIISAIESKITGKDSTIKTVITVDRY